VLAFSLPEPVITGTVSFTEPGGGISDWLASPTRLVSSMAQARGRER